MTPYLGPFHAVMIRKRATMKFVNCKICVAIDDPLRIVPILVSVNKLTCLPNILTNLATFTVTSALLEYLVPLLVFFPLA